MLSTQFKRGYSSNNSRLNKSVCVMANTKSGDLVGQKLMQNLKVVSGVEDFAFFGYGGPAMKQEGMAATIDLDMDDLQNKEFVTTRKTKNYSEVQYSTKYNFVNLINKHFVRGSNQILNQFDQIDLARRIYHARPSVILSIDNEYITFKIHDQIKGKPLFMSKTSILKVTMRTAQTIFLVVISTTASLRTINSGPPNTLISSTIPSPSSTEALMASNSQESTQASMASTRRFVISTLSQRNLRTS